MTGAVSENGLILNLAVKNVVVGKNGSDTGFTQVMDQAVNARNSEITPSVANSGPSAYQRGANTENAETADSKCHSEEARKTDVSQQEKPEAISKAPKAAEKKEAAKDTDVTEAGEEAVSSMTMQAVMQKAQELAESVAEGLSVSMQEVGQAMEEMQMNLTDILDPGRMQELVMAITGEDQATIVTDEALYQKLQDLTKMVLEAGSDLMKELSMEPEDLQSLLEKLGEMQADARKGNEPDVRMPQESVQTVGSEEVLPDPGMEDIAKISMSSKPESNQEEPENQDAGADAKSSRDTGVWDGIRNTDMQGSHMTGAQSSPSDGSKISISEEMGEHERTEKADGKGWIGNEHISFADQILNRTNEFLEALTQEAGSPYEGVDAEKIMKQITDFMKLQVTPQSSEVEIQLHPASLGTLNISVAAKNGLVTAQFTAQDEAVRAILEGQVAELKSRLEEQGVKVEAVEVTVASHEFERNLEQNADPDANERGEGKAKRRTTRKLNLDELNEEDVQDLDDAQTIAVDMMRIHGNRLDYLA